MTYEGKTSKYRSRLKINHIIDGFHMNKSGLPIGFALLAGMMLSSCSQNSRQTDDNLITIDLAKQIEAPPTGLEQAEAHIVLKPPVTDSTMLMPSYRWRGATLRDVRDGRLMLINNQSMMTFDEADGHCLYSFSHQGQGPEEYTSLSPYTFVGRDGNWNTAASKGINVYTPEGAFVGFHEVDSLREFAPLAGGYWAVLTAEFDCPHMIYIFDERWQPVKQIQSSVMSRHYLLDNTRVTEIVDFYRSNNFVGIVQSDTLMAIDPKADRLQPIAVIDCGAYSKPDEYKDLQDIRDNVTKRIAFKTFPVGKYLMVSSFMGEKAWLQFYDFTDGRLVYSNTGTRDLENYSVNYPIEIEGTTYPCNITTCVDGPTLYMVVEPEFMAELTGDEDANPAFIALTLKD